ncbi:MAG: cytidylate kinase-like family protein [Solobacterium sp.]|jgi:cytidylate kinase|nr:cytidylate kinase-like family protein [Solobacterium sp.]MDO4192450.1 cytidylate kinase-like family protein [Erysipelotrichaceae bacterium]MBQ6490358.1 cytidylate kinase-like family protein [Solobacterium sp.]MBR2843691.1 cytidylate kinase-like family protein [Solobacterium sp.]MBR3343020.1 cytidylate kinase-like family protein [Solobacterium sp.]
MGNRIITISRQFGSGGRTIGQEVANRLGIPCYDKELITNIAEESGFAKEYIEEHGEATENGGWLAGAFARDFNGHSNQDTIWFAQCRIIRELADKGNCVIIGRCADYILKDREDLDLMRVFVHADIETRAKRIVEQYGESNVEPEKRLRDKDKRRAAYYQIYTDQKWGRCENYDVCLDSGTLGIEKCIEIIVCMY